MKRLLLILLFFSALANAQIVNIPDATFKALLTQTMCVALPSGQYISDVDTNDDGEIQLSEAQAVQYLYANNYFYPIADLTGIEAFTNLKLLDCTSNALTTLDITALTQLEELGCSHNNLSSIQFPAVSALKRMHCVNNQLTSINTAALPNIEYLDCKDNLLTSINLIGLPHLEELDIQFNLFTNLDLGVIPNLKIAKVGYNDLTNINLVGATSLERLECQGNQLTAVNLPVLPNLHQLSFFQNQLTTLDVSNLSGLQNLDCRENQLTNLDLSGLPNLNHVFCNWNVNLASINLNGAAGLININCYATGLTTLDVSDSPNLSYLDVSWCGYLESLFVKNGALETVIFEYSSSLDYICADEGQIGTLQQTILDSNYLHYNMNCVINSYCSFALGGNHNTITGVASFDTNNNCDDLDIQYPNLKVSINDGTNQGAAFTNANGAYSFDTIEGNYTLTPEVENPTWFTISPTSATVVFADSDNNTAIENFCISANGFHNDVEVVIVPTNVARPGFTSNYTIVYKNKGNHSLSGGISFAFDDALSNYVNASVNPDLQTAGNLNWSYTDLLPFETRVIYLTLLVNAPTETPAVNIGDVLSYSASITPSIEDETPNDNVFNLSQTVVGSFDPNDKTCLEGNTVSPTRIGEYLHYNINFENTGNFQAENIVVKDVIDTAVFDINSLQVLNASHPLVTRVLGDKIEFIFENINLAGNGHGNVVFKIKTKSTLVTGNTVTNKADIYFDYNAPVATNIASTTFQSLNIDEHQIYNSVKIYPNPANDFINVMSNNIIKAIELYDVQGRILAAKISDDIQDRFDISTYQNGVYFLKVKTEAGLKIQKLIKE